MTADPDPLSRLTASIVDGEPIDWDAACAAASNDDVRRLLEHLRIVAGVADVHRSLVDESPTGPTLPHEAIAAALPATRAAAGRWGHLLLLRKIGEGAFGEVYEALDTWLDHRRALKLLRPEIANRSSAPQILHEARKLARVRHPNVVMVHGADKHDGRVGFWMDLIEGHTLEERVREGRLSAGEAIIIGQELCSALAAVHHANLLHRDVKAQNVMRSTDDGRIILMDFGAGEFRDAPNDGRPQGTPAYLAPEIFKGAPATVQTDIYALGVLLFYLVTGRFPVEGRSFFDIAVGHDRGLRRHLRDARPDLPDAFVRIVERAIDVNPEQRFRSAGDFHAALGGHVATPAVIRPPQVVVPPQTPLLHRAGYALVAVAAAVTGIEIAGFVASRTFEVALHVDPPFTTPAASYFRLGVEAMVPFAIYSVLGIAGVTLFNAACELLRKPLAPLWHPCAKRLNAAEPTTLATVIAVMGGVSWLLLTWINWPLYAALLALQGAETTPKGPPLGPEFYDIFLRHSHLSAVLTSLLAFTIWRWWPRLEHQSSDVTIRRAKWVLATVAIIAAGMAIAPRRLAMERFDVVQYQNREFYVIGSAGKELLLYAEDQLDGSRQRVAADAAGLQRTGSRKLVERKPGQPGS